MPTVRESPMNRASLKYSEVLVTNSASSVTTGFAVVGSASASDEVGSASEGSVSVSGCSDTASVVASTVDTVGSFLAAFGCFTELVSHICVYMNGYATRQVSISITVYIHCLYLFIKVTSYFKFIAYHQNLKYMNGSLSPLYIQYTAAQNTAKSRILQTMVSLYFS